jgi:glycosyltransferase involved in cell wall biosynthesis
VLLSALTMTNCAAAAGAKLSGTATAVVQTEHNPVVVRCRHTGLRRAAYIRLLRTSYEMAQAVVAVSAGVGKEISTITRGAVQARIIYNPVVGKEPGACAELPHPWLRHGEPPCILAVGRLRPEKNFGLLLRAFDLLRKQRPCRLIILGEGSERAGLEAERDRLGLTDSVLLPGFVSTPSHWMAHAALFVCSSAYEGFGNVIVEALECGVPVVSTDCPFGPAEILDGGRFGRLVPNDRADLLAAAMACSLDDPVDGDLLRARAAMFSRARAVDAYAGLLEQFL